ncbi:MAG: crossover junction endodeoxyribonuclease RuvC [Firmicutes bacterium]|nr:crossover junction endodeoxyribonuclease RuvC [Bacillota bacterium]
MIVLGIDPGTAITGYGVVRSGRDRIEALDFGCLLTTAGRPARERLKAIHDGVLRLIETHSPDAIAVEKLFFCRNITTAMAVGEARGAVLVAAASCSAVVCEFTPMQVKQAVTGYGKADKQQVQAMVRTLLGLRETPSPDDVADALASAIAGVHIMETAARMGAGASVVVRA